MAKKLMMNNYSENGLMPVMDGLVCWLDGRDYDDSTNTIKCRVSDIIAKANFPLANSKCNLAKNSIKCENMYFSLSNTKVLGVTATLELYCDIQIQHDRANCLFEGNGGFGSFGIWYGDNTSDIPTPHKFSYHDSGSANRLSDAFTSDIITPTGFHAITGISDVNNNKIYVDNVQNSIVNRLNNLNLIFNNNCTFIGRKNGYYPQSIFFGSLKIYNRALTEEEIAKNYAYEQSINRGE